MRSLSLLIFVFSYRLLTGIKINSEEDAFLAMDMLHEQGIPIVVLSSSDLGDETVLIALGSKLKEDGTKERMRFSIPRLGASFVGTGDLFAALLLAWLSNSGGDLKQALEMVISTMQAVLRRTFDFASKHGLSSSSLELKLVQSKRDIEEPKPAKGEVL